MIWLPTQLVTDPQGGPSMFDTITAPARTQCCVCRIWVPMGSPMFMSPDTGPCCSQNCADPRTRPDTMPSRAGYFDDGYDEDNATLHAEINELEEELEDYREGMTTLPDPTDCPSCGIHLCAGATAYTSALGLCCSKTCADPKTRHLRTEAKAS